MPVSVSTKSVVGIEVVFGCFVAGSAVVAFLSGFKIGEFSTLEQAHIVCYTATGLGGAALIAMIAVASVAARRQATSKSEEEGRSVVSGGSSASSDGSISASVASEEEGTSSHHSAPPPASTPAAPAPAPAAAYDVELQRRLGDLSSGGIKVTGNTAMGCVELSE